MEITIITDLERATHILNDAADYYKAELFEPKDKLFGDQTGVKITFPDYYNADMAALIMFHVGVRFGIDKGIEVLSPKKISVDGRN